MLPERNQESKARTFQAYGHLRNMEELPILRRWTVSSANCFARMGDCRGCVNTRYCKQARYVMTKVVDKLIIERGVGRILSDIAEENYIFLDKKLISSTMIKDERKTSNQ